MNALLAGAVVVATAVGCTPTVSRDSSHGDREVAYDCDNGQSVSVRFFPARGVAALVRNGETIELQQRPTGSGFMYTTGQNTIRGKGNELTLQIGRMVPIQCTTR